MKEKMFSSNKELKQEIRRLNKNLSRRIENIEGLGNSVPLYAVNSYRNIEKDIPNVLKTDNTDKLYDMYRDLKYINDLKSSSVKGALHTQRVFEEKVGSELRTKYTEEEQKEFWDLYDTVYNYYKNARQFKYEEIENLFELYKKGEYKIEDIRNKLLKEYTRLNIKGTREDLDDYEVNRLFVQNIKSIFDKNR